MWQKRLSKVANAVFSRQVLRAILGFLIFLTIWEVGGHSEQWFGYRFPWIGMVPPPDAVITTWVGLLPDPGYWHSWMSSFIRVIAGFLIAVVVGIPFGLLLAVNRTMHGVFYPPFELLRPIPPLAWVPASIIFWPSQELSITFVIFIGAFYIIVLNVLGGAQSVDVRYMQAARSMGATGWTIFRRITLPAVLPSIFVGCAVGMGITWEVVVAAEMISGGGGGGRGGSGGGLGFFIWNSYVGGDYPQIIVGMISIGLAGYFSSSMIRVLGKMSTPWLRLR